MKRAIVLLGGAVICDADVWRTARLDEGDGRAVTGDYLRVAAVACLYKRYPGSTCILSGGSVKYNAPTVAYVNKQELLRDGVPEESIRLEERSLNTWQQLQSLNTLIPDGRVDHVLIVSNTWHLPRVCAMILRDQYLSSLLQKGVIELVGAEEVLTQYDAFTWKQMLEDWYASPGLRARIELEERGISDLRSGNYRFV